MTYEYENSVTYKYEERDGLRRYSSSRGDVWFSVPKAVEHLAERSTALLADNLAQQDHLPRAEQKLTTLEIEFAWRQKDLAHLKALRAALTAGVPAAWHEALAAQIEDEHARCAHYRDDLAELCQGEEYDGVIRFSSDDEWWLEPVWSEQRWLAVAARKREQSRRRLLRWTLPHLIACSRQLVIEIEELDRTLARELPEEWLEALRKTRQRRQVSLELMAARIAARLKSQSKTLLATVATATPPVESASQRRQSSASR